MFQFIYIFSFYHCILIFVLYIMSILNGGKNEYFSINYNYDFNI